jgi:hypothetical protein
MANRTATLYIRITTADCRKSYCKPVYLSKGRLKSQYDLSLLTARSPPRSLLFADHSTTVAASFRAPRGNQAGLIDCASNPA